MCPLWLNLLILSALCTFYLHYTDYQCVTECRQVCILHTHYLHLSIISLHLSALACTFVYTLTLYLHILALACTLSTLTYTRWHFIYTYLHSLTLCLHPLAHLLTGTNKPVFYTNLCKDISIVVFRPCLVARSLMTVSVASIGRQTCRLLQLKFRSPVTGLPWCYNHLVAHTTVWANHSFLALRQQAEQLKASYSVSG